MGSEQDNKEMENNKEIDQINELDDKDASEIANPTNGFAIGSLIFGILSFIGLYIFAIPQILAIVFGAVGLKQISLHDEEGRGLAVAGIVLGTIYVFELIYMLAIR